jgi:hypothetical protein
MAPDMDTREEAEQTIFCANHPSVETNLRCGRCDKPICGRCVIITPGGQRCRECARLRPPPAYDLSLMLKLRAAGAAAGVALVAGVAWSLLPRFFGLFVFLAAAGLGYLMSEAVSRASNRKRGYTLQIIAGLGILLAYFMRNLILQGVPVVIGDIFGYIAVGIAILVAVGPLR